MDSETQTAIYELREDLASLRQSVRLLDAAIEDLTNTVLRLHNLPALPCEHGFASSCPEGCN